MREYQSAVRSVVFSHVSSMVLGCTHTWPSCSMLCWSANVPSPLSPAGLHSHCSSLTVPELTWAPWSTECDLYYPHFLHLLVMLLNCFLVTAIYKTVTDFSTALYADIVCCCPPAFEVNPPKTVDMMSALCACARARASVPRWSPPLPTVPGPTKRAVLEYGTERSY